VKRAALVAVAGVVALLAGAQFILPSLAEQRLRDDLKPVGDVRSVGVSAFPALKLLWHRADAVDVDLRSYESGTGVLADFLARTEHTDDLDVRVDRFRAAILTLSDVTLRKRGDELETSASVRADDLAAALPPGFELTPEATGDGTLVLRGTARAFGRMISLRARLEARDGKLVVSPADIPFVGGLLTLTVFDDPRLRAQAVGATREADGFTVTARARLAG
jgi:hypothetical protein